ncbi:hypothetical protein BC829DRAFT_445373 [Chytridium lagenaria]|nr:hypothetical protein BC829DRAFT_445373 [Chytridium lagenaria]
MLAQTLLILRAKWAYWAVHRVEQHAKSGFDEYGTKAIELLRGLRSAIGSPTGGEKYGLPLTDEEASVYAKLFKLADVGGTSLIPPQAAAEFIRKSGLPNQALSEVILMKCDLLNVYPIALGWKAAQVSAAGATPMEFYRMLKFVSLQQANISASVQNLGLKSPLPKFEGIAIPTSTSTLSSPAKQVFNAGTSLPNNDILDAEKAERFKAAFESCNPSGGYITADAARTLFLKSNISTEALANIWELVENTGAARINSRQFYAAMYIIFRLKDGSLAQVPPAVPKVLWDAIDAVVAPTVTPLQASSSEWAIPLEERASSAQLFDQLDTSKTGFLTDSSSLANIWDLSNIGEKGRLSKDEFIVAMHLIRSKMGGKPLPSVLPINLVPPSLRKPAVAAATAPPALRTMSSFDNSLISKTPMRPASPARDSFGLDSFSSSLNSSSTISSKQIKQLIPSSVISARPDTVASLGNEDKLGANSPKSPAGDVRLSNFDLSRGLEPSSLGSDELRAKRAVNEGELRSAIAKKQELTLKLTQSKATYEAEERIFTENIAVLKEDTQSTLYSEQDLQKNEEVLKSVKTDRESLQAVLKQRVGEVESIRGQVQQVMAEISQFDKDIAQMNSEFQMSHAEMKKQSEILEISVRRQLSRDQEKLEWTRKRLAEVNNKIAVQNAMTEKEKERTKTLSESLMGLDPPPLLPQHRGQQHLFPNGNLLSDLESPKKAAPATAMVPGTTAKSPPPLTFSNFDDMIKADSAASTKAMVEEPVAKSPSTVADFSNAFTAPPNGVPKPTVPAVAALATTPYLRLDSFTSAASSNTNDTSSLHSTTRKGPRFMTVNLEAELSNAFTALPDAKTATEAVVTPIPQSKLDDDFDFDTSFSNPSRTSKPSTAAPNAFSVDFDSAFESSFPPPTAPPPIAASPVVKKSDFEAVFDVATNAPAASASASFGFDDVFGALPVTQAPVQDNGGVKLSSEDLDAVFGGLSLSSKPVTQPASTASAPFGFESAFGDTFNFSEPAETPLKADEEVTDEVQQLMNMGFSKGASIIALEKNGFDVVKASNYLIDGN